MYLGTIQFLIGCVPWIKSSRNKETIQSRQWRITILDSSGEQCVEGMRGPVIPTHTPISPPVRVATVTIYAKTTLHRSPSFSMIY
jgi:hypothetical protein